MNKSKSVNDKNQAAKAEKPSVEVQQTATKIAGGIKKPGQTKEQTKLIEQGIQKGIEQYKKLHKAKAREADKAKKKLQKAKSATITDDAEAESGAKSNFAPWLLLAISWLGFVLYSVFI
ncbi:DUF2956 domain-containing protein [Colwelliaceae bacterium BS250]